MADCCSQGSSSSRFPSTHALTLSVWLLKQRRRRQYHHHHQQQQQQQRHNNLHRHYSGPNVRVLQLMTVVSFLLLSPPQASVLVGGAACTSRDISISQSRVSSGSSGIPEFIVQIFNTCTAGCAPSQVHVNCGWFASAEMVNPLLFRRLTPNDCLVNAGLPLTRDHIIHFTYQNSFMYPLSFKSASFC